MDAIWICGEWETCSKEAVDPKSKPTVIASISVKLIVSKKLRICRSKIIILSKKELDRLIEAYLTVFLDSTECNNHSIFPEQAARIMK
jgi:hypothetical protein